LWLALLVVLCTACPAEMARVAVVMSGRGGAVVQARVDTWSREVGLPMVYVVVAGLAVAISPRHDALVGPHPWVAAVAVVVAPLVVAGEAAVGAVILVLGGHRPRGFTLHGAWSGATAATVIAAAVVAVCEEVVFRDLWPADLHALLGLAAAVVLGLSAIVYGLNHWYLGGTAVVQKVLAGLVYGGLVVAGGGVVAPVVAHLVQNVGVLLVGRRP
jgi:membrane protease YdiL (CAAX protease family)